MSDIRPMEMMVQFALSKQASMVKLYNHFRMAELLPHIFTAEAVMPCSRYSLPARNTNTAGTSVITAATKE